MILQRLAEQYDRMEAEGVTGLASEGFSEQKISFVIVLNSNGTLNQFESLLQPEGKSLQPRRMIVPGQSKPSGKGLNPCFLWDNAEYLLGYAQEPERVERASKEFEASRDLHLGAEQAINHQAFTAVCTFLRNWSPQQGAYHPELEKITSHFGVFRIAGAMQYVHQQVSRPDAPETEFVEQDTTLACLVSGTELPVARLHQPAIKGVAGAQSSGALLVSFNKGAFTSYGKEQSFNAPVGKTATFKYATALNLLLSSRERRIRIGDATVVYWADHHTPVEDVFAHIFQDNPAEIASTDEVQEDVTRLEQAKQLLLQMRSGTEPVKWKTDDIPTRFFILGLSPNASRLSVRFWIEADTSEILHRLETHIRDLSFNGVEELPSIWRIAQATGRAVFEKDRFKHYDGDSISPKLAGDLTRAILTGAAYPQSLMATLIRRISMDGHIRGDRVCAIKACLLRNTRPTANPLEIPMELNETSTDIAYRCGCLFAILEKVQRDSADGELSATIKDRYFSSASATPGIVFPRLFRLNGHHLAKLETGARIYYEKMIAPIMAEPFEFPRRLSLLEQGRFIVGYFQQNQRLYTRKQESNTEENS